MQNINLKLLIPTLLITLLAIVSTAYISFLQYQGFQNQERELTDKHLSGLKNLLQMQRQKNRDLIHLLSHKESFIKAAALRNRTALLHEIIPYFEQLEYGVVNLYDMKGMLIARADLPDIYGNPDELSPFVLKAIKENKTVSSVSMYNGLLTFFSIKRLPGPNPSGVLVVGNYLDQPSVDYLARTNNVDIKFYLNGDEIVSSTKYNNVIKPGSERSTLIDMSGEFYGHESFKMLLIEDTSEALKKFRHHLAGILLAIVGFSAVIIFFSRRTILSAADSLNSALISAERKSRELNRVNEQLDREIGERRKIECELRRSHEDLEMRVVARTSELKSANKQLHNLAAHLQSIREEERINIARDIHDELGQALSAMNMDLSCFRAKYSDNQHIVEKCNSMLNTLNSIILSVKRICTDLRPSILDHFGLVAAVEWQANEFSKRTGIESIFSSSHEAIEMDQERSTVIFRISQEALTNVIKHANATEVTISLMKQDDQVTLEVIDNGIGITAEHLFKQQSFGIIGMRERLYPWGGKLEISCLHNNAGTHIKAIIPFA